VDRTTNDPRFDFWKTLGDSAIATSKCGLVDVLYGIAVFTSYLKLRSSV
jgi:hypothetical protein